MVNPPTTGDAQPQADAECATCGHYGASHLRLGDQPAHCRCGCTNWAVDRMTGPIGLIITS